MYKTCHLHDRADAAVIGDGFQGQDQKTSIKWAYMEYLRLVANQQSSLKIGSFKPYFGREFLTLGPQFAW
jgi:hypothetical protein